jgi:ankyrin repeat domain-containing protein 13
VEIIDTNMQAHSTDTAEVTTTPPLGCWNLHKLVWLDDIEGLKNYLQTMKPSTKELEEQDCRGNTPLILAILLGRKQAIEELLRAGASSLTPNRDSWYPLQEATSIGSRELVRKLLMQQHQELRAYLVERRPMLIRELANTKDFYLEMHWQFRSWSKFCSKE